MRFTIAMTAKVPGLKVADPSRRTEASHGTISIMYVVFVIVAAAVLFAVVAVTLGRGDLMEAEPPAVAGPELSPDALHAEDLDELRFSVAVRGYRMDQVEVVLDRLATELAQRDRHIAELREQLDRLAAAAPRQPRPPWTPGTPGTPETRRPPGTPGTPGTPGI
ncbi:DivIVA domain-containing protein [Phytoactinopolyspora halotolerans]|uniref:DivIVA domain-containing protein n=1 Tax=Phytoactinopolyspora halotolerans TaxID=1981512 RepID=UPI001C2021A4|nr:DivIVA domain-containing protein [Phytoactinopolyspora halotolerans]